MLPLGKRMEPRLGNRTRITPPGSDNGRRIVRILLIFRLYSLLLTKTSLRLGSTAFFILATQGWGLSTMVAWLQANTNRPNRPYPPLNKFK